MRRLLAGVCLAAGFAAPAAATSIAPSAFGAGSMMESFEGMSSLDPNVGSVSLFGAPVDALVEPGAVKAYAFPGPLALTAPIPNPGIMNQGPYVHDFALGNDVQNDWGGSRIVDDAADVPFGSAYLGAFDPSGGVASVEFTFAQPMVRVGAYVTGAVGETVTLQAFGAGGALLESQTLPTVDLPLWGSNFLGIENAAGIRSIVVSGADLGLDGLTFEPAVVVPVPELGTLPSVGVGLVGLLGLATMGRGRRMRAAEGRRCG
jgi:hypothetical protein